MIKRNLFNLFFLALALIPIISLIHPGYPITHDGQDHVARIANFYLNLTEGNLIPRWASNLNWGYGHPILEFLYPLPSYIASFFHYIGLSLVDSTKIVFGLGMVLSFVFMFTWLNQFLGRASSVFGAILYTYAPYRFVELYVRGDIGENLAFAFVPVVLFFMYKIYKNYHSKYIVMGSISLAFLILAHNAISLMFTPLIFLYALLLIYLSKNKRNQIINFILVFIFGFSLSAFFWVPALIEGKYTLRNIVTKGGYINSFVNISSFIYGKWSYGITGQFTVQFGPLHWLALLSSPFVFYKSKRDISIKGILYILWLFTFIAIFLMLPISNLVWSRIMLLQNFQFPWRFLAIIVFTTSVMGALLVDTLPKKINKNYFVAIGAILILMISFFYARPRAYQQKNESFYTGIYYSTTDTGESAPIWSVRFMEHSPKASAEIIAGRGSISEQARKVTYRKYLLSAYTRAGILINILYFPGWHIFIDGKESTIQFQDTNNRGLMTFVVDKGKHVVEAKFEETNLRLIADILSALSVLGLIIFFLMRIKKN